MRFTFKHIFAFLGMFLFILSSCVPIDRNGSDFPNDQGVDSRKSTLDISIIEVEPSQSQFFPRENIEDECIVGKFTPGGLGNYLSQFLLIHDELNNNWPDPYTVEVVEDGGYVPDFEFLADGTFSMIAKDTEDISAQVQIQDLDTGAVASNIYLKITGQESANYIIENGKLIFFNTNNQMVYTFEVDGTKYVENFDILELVSDSAYECYPNSNLYLNTSVNSDNEYTKYNGFVFFALWK